MRYAPLLLSALLLAGCSPVHDDTVEYVSVPRESIPDLYPDGSFSIQGFLKNRTQYENQTVRIKGIVSFIYECPRCPRGAFCKPCAGNHIILGDPLENITDYNYHSENKMPVNFVGEREFYSSLKVGQELTIEVGYTTTRGGVTSRYGLFVYPGIIKQAAP